MTRNELRSWSCNQLSSKYTVDRNIGKAVIREMDAFDFLYTAAKALCERVCDGDNGPPQFYASEANDLDDCLRTIEAGRDI